MSRTDGGKMDTDGGKMDNAYRNPAKLPEYKIVDCACRSLAQDTINKMVAEGWEFVSITSADRWTTLVVMVRR